MNCKDWETNSKNELRLAQLRESQPLDYNQLKIRVLDLFHRSQELASEDILKLLRESKIASSDKAVKMALMRYTRQGLLARNKKTGVFCYRLTEKGSARRDWLSRTR